MNQIVIDELNGYGRVFWWDEVKDELKKPAIQLGLFNELRYSMMQAGILMQEGICFRQLNFSVMIKPKTCSRSLHLPISHSSSIVRMLNV